MTQHHNIKDKMYPLKNKSTGKKRMVLADKTRMK